MPEIKPFRGILFDPARVAIADAVAPPYDVIGPELRDALYARSPHNIVRLDYAREPDPYAAAAAALRAWRAEGVLRQDAAPALYLLAQVFTLPGGETVRRTGFIAACRLEEFGRGSVHPHERTLAKPKEDRFRLMDATGAVFSQVFGLYSDPKRTLAPLLAPWFRRDPLFDLEADDVRNTLWRCDDPAVALAAADVLQRHAVVVADGHHRYETAVAFADAMRLKNPGHSGKEPYNFAPMFFTNVHDPGLVILPTHRLVHDLAGFDAGALRRALSPSFAAEPCADAAALQRALVEAGHRSFGLVLAEAPRFLLLRWIGRGAPPGTQGLPPAVAALDVAILHGAILERILGITPEMQAQKLHLDYVRNAAEAVAAVAGARAQAAFLMNAPTIEEVRMVAEGGFVMPQKSTYFYPKLLSGLVTYAVTAP